MWESEIQLWFVCFLCKTLPKRLKFNEIDIYMFKVKKKNSSVVFIDDFENYFILHLPLVWHLLYSLSYVQKQSPRGVLHLASLQENIHAEVWV